MHAYFTLTSICFGFASSALGMLIVRIPSLYSASILSLLTKPFAIGLYVGLVFSLFVFIRGKAAQHRLKIEIEALKRHLQTKLDIESEELERRKKDLEKLKKENENLRLTLQTYLSKPGRGELRQLHVYQKALGILTEKAPGFAPSWQSALREGEEEIRQTEFGLLPLVRRLIPWTGRRHRRPREIENGES